MYTYCVFCETVRCDYVARTAEQTLHCKSVSPKQVQHTWFQGKMVDVLHDLFPGYVFMYTDEPTMPYPGVLADDATEEDEARYQTSMEEWDQLSLDGLTLYELDTDKATSLLEEAGWTLNAHGEAFDLETDDVRYRLVNGELRALELKLGYQPRADLDQAFSDYLVQNLARVGIRLTVPLLILTLLWKRIMSRRLTDWI